MVTGCVVSGFYLIQLLKSWDHVSSFLFPCPHCTLFHPRLPSHHLVGFMKRWALAGHRPCAGFDPAWSSINKMAFAEFLQAGSKEQQRGVWLTWGWDGVPCLADSAF